MNRQVYPVTQFFLLIARDSQTLDDGQKARFHVYLTSHLRFSNVSEEFRRNVAIYIYKEKNDVLTLDQIFQQRQSVKGKRVRRFLANDRSQDEGFQPYFISEARQDFGKANVIEKPTDFIQGR